MKKQKAKKVPVKKARATKTHAATSRDEVIVGVTALKSLKTKTPERRKRHPAFERSVRDEIDRDSGRMTSLEQVFDRVNDYTREVPTFHDTGKVKFSKEGKLSEKNKPR